MPIFTIWLGYSRMVPLSFECLQGGKVSNLKIHDKLLAAAVAFCNSSRNGYTILEGGVQFCDHICG